MNYDLPKKVTVSEIVSTRYKESKGKRLDSWDDRISGIDIIKSTHGDTIRLVSDGMQSTPQAGWSIMLTEGNNELGYKWTLHGIFS